MSNFIYLHEGQHVTVEKFVVVQQTATGGNFANTCRLPIVSGMKEKTRMVPHPVNTNNTAYEKVYPVQLFTNVSLIPNVYLFCIIQLEITSAANSWMILKTNIFLHDANLPLYRSMPK